MNTQLEALRLADELCEKIPGFPAPTRLEEAAAAELRRLYEVNQELLEALRLAEAAFIFGANMNMTVVVRKIQAAIVKATGEQP